MQATIDSTNYKREKQAKYNSENNITPTQIKKSLDNALSKPKAKEYSLEEMLVHAAEEAKNKYETKPQLEKKIRDTRKAMEIASKELDFIQAAKYRDQLTTLQKQIENVQ